MKIILFRFEKEKINFVECDLNSGNLVIGDKERIPLESTDNRGEKYNKVMDELLHLYTTYSANLFMYQSPQKYKGCIKDEEGFANSSMLHLFCYQYSIDLLELTPTIVRHKLSIPNSEFKVAIAQEKIFVCEKYNIAKSDKIVDGLVLLSLIRVLL
jgi:hypothetical protein